MRHPRIIVFEPDSRLASILAPLAERRSWSLRQPARVEGCLRSLEGGNSTVLVVRCGRDLEREFGLIEQVSRTSPATAIVLVTDSDHPRLHGLAWDLGVAYVLASNQVRDRLAELIEALLDSPPISGGPGSSV